MCNRGTTLSSSHQRRHCELTMATITGILNTLPERSEPRLLKAGEEIIKIAEKVMFDTSNQTNITQVKYQQYDTDGTIRHSLKIQEQYSCEIHGIAYKNLVKLLESPISVAETVSGINSGLTGDGKIFNGYIKNVKFGDRLKYAILKKETKTGPKIYYTYRAESDKFLTNTEWPFTVYEIGINYASGKEKSCVNFVIKVHGTFPAPLKFSSYENCLKTFNCLEFNIHIKSAKRNIEDQNTFASVVDTVLTNASARNFNCTSFLNDVKTLQYIQDDTLKVSSPKTFLPENYKYTVPP